MTGHCLVDDWVDDWVGHWVESKAERLVVKVDSKVELMVVDWVGQKDAVKVAS
jgi:hypothetical protein